MKRITCYILAVATLGGGLAKMDWIYKELRRQEENGTYLSAQQQTELLNVPQYFRYNQHYTLGLQIDEHIDPKVRNAYHDLLNLGKELLVDDKFSHIFKKVESEHLVSGIDGDFVNMECSSWLDLSQEAEQARYNTPVWQTDFSQIKAIERNDIVKLLPITDELADQLLKPLLGYCLGQNIDIWRYTLCIGAFSRQEMLLKSSANGAKEVYSLGINERLPEDTKQYVNKLLLDETQETETIAQIAITKKQFDLHNSVENIIDSYIERSRKTIFERIQARGIERNIEDQRIEKMMTKQKVVDGGNQIRPVFTAESVVVLHVPIFESNLAQQSRLHFIVKSHRTNEVCFEMVFSSFFGVRFINYLSNQDEPQETYLDIDLDLNRSTDKLFLIIHDEKLFITSSGLSFVDIIYSGDFNAGQGDMFYIEFNQEYIFPTTVNSKYRYEVLPIDEIPASLQSQLNVIRDSLGYSEEEIEEEIKETGASSKIDINKKLFYEVVYENGSVCAVTNKPRLTRVHFYCDQYQTEKNNAMTVIDISEPDYCEYLFKVSTRFMCAAGTQFNKASSKLHTTTQHESSRPELNLDAWGRTIRKSLNCQIKSDF